MTPYSTPRQAAQQIDNLEKNTKGPWARSIPRPFADGQAIK
jgi:hypothetical protein